MPENAATYLQLPRCTVAPWRPCNSHRERTRREEALLPRPPGLGSPSPLLRLHTPPPRFQPGRPVVPPPPQASPSPSRRAHRVLAPRPSAPQSSLRPNSSTLSPPRGPAHSIAKASPPGQTPAVANATSPPTRPVRTRTPRRRSPASALPALGRDRDAFCSAHTGPSTHPPRFVLPEGRGPL